MTVRMTSLKSHAKHLGTPLLKLFGAGTTWLTNMGRWLDWSSSVSLCFPATSAVTNGFEARASNMGLDSDGDILELILIWVDSGIDTLWMFEVQAGMDVNAVRREFGNAFVMFGGIDKKEIATGGWFLRAEADRVVPTVEKGGYIPELDHSVHPDISRPVFCGYIEYLKTRPGRG
jgi:hypothetical protein